MISRILFILFAVLTLALPFACVRSQQVKEAWSWYGSEKAYHFWQGDGFIAFVWSELRWPTEDPSFKYRRFPGVSAGYYMGPRTITKQTFAGITYHSTSWPLNAQTRVEHRYEVRFVTLSFILLIVTALLGWRVWKTWPRDHQCPKCGYDLTGSPGPCPECGFEAKYGDVVSPKAAARYRASLQKSRGHHD